MLNFPPEHNDEPPQDPCLLLTLATIMLVAAWLGAMQ